MSGHKHTQEIILDYNLIDVYNCIANVEDYPNFIPWISKINTINAYDNIKEFDVFVDFKLFSEKFSTKDVFYPNEKIEIFLLSGPFKHLYNKWEFKRINANKTKIDFYIEFSFKNKMLDIAFGKVFLQAQKVIISSFVKQLKSNIDNIL